MYKDIPVSAVRQRFSLTYLDPLGEPREVGRLWPLGWRQGSLFSIGSDDSWRQRKSRIFASRYPSIRAARIQPLKRGSVSLEFQVEESEENTVGLPLTETLTLTESEVNS